MAGHRGGLGLGRRALAADATGGASLAVEIKLMLAGVVVVVLGALALLAMLVFVGAGDANAGGGGAVTCAASPTGKEQIPQRFMPIYKRAAGRFSLADRGVWVLASIHSHETGFGESRAISTAGALGPMQFMPTTWIKGGSGGAGRIVTRPTASTSEGYATDGDDDGMADTNNVHDAIHAAARYLRANGAPADWAKAIFAYNHAEWYVDMVEERAESFQGSCTLDAGGGPAVPIGDLDYNDTGGAWGGSMKFAKALAALGRRHGCAPMSEKRSTQLTATGGISDHWTGATTSYAVDIAACSLTFPGGPLDQTANEIARVLRLPSRTGVQEVIHGSYRFQLLWQTMKGGNHYDHVHIGVKLVAPPTQ